MGYDFIIAGRVQGKDENCLYLNVFTSDVTTQRHGDSVQGKKKKVLVFFHGGGFQIGSTKLYGAKYFMDHEDIVLVTVQYRVGIFGFLSSNDAVIKGNMGLKE